MAKKLLKNNKSSIKTDKKIVRGRRLRKGETHAPTVCQFKPGQSGNPGGRPKKEKCIGDILRRIGDERAPKKFIDKLKAIDPDGQFDGLTNRDAIMYKVTFDAEDGNYPAREFIAERTEGKVASTIKLDFDPEEINLQLNGNPEEPKQDDND